MEDWENWRKQQRATLIAQRMQISCTDRISWSDAITTALIQGFPILQQLSVGFYSAYKGEYDPTPVMNHLATQGALIGLPEVITFGEPLVFRRWWPEVPTRKDLYGISVPKDTESITINAVIIPMVGFDNQGYRLGYGSGYFDRTLATLSPRPLTIGIAFEQLRITTTHPQVHDIAMDFVITEKSIYVLEEILRPISLEKSTTMCKQFLYRKGINFGNLDN